MSSRPPSDPPKSGPHTWADVSIPQPESGEWALDDPASPVDGDRQYQRGVVLGEGGMGTVYLATDERLRRQVALKEARGHPKGPSATRLRREARIMAALDHPGIVPVYDMGVGDDGTPWYAMRVVRGRTLKEALEAADGLAERLRLLRPFLGACEAVAYAHHRGVVHRDLKPDNIILGPFGESQVVDWGLARPVDDGGQGWDAVLSGVSATMVGSVLGTPSYMSPEQATGDTVYQTSDVWALGVCLFEVLTGERAYAAETTPAVLAMVLTQPVPDPCQVDRGVPTELSAIVHRCTARTPNERYPDAAAVVADLEAYLDGRRVSSHTYTASDEVRIVLRRNRRALMAYAALAFTAIGAVGLAWWNAVDQRDQALQSRAAIDQAKVQSDAHLARALVAQGRAADRERARAEAEVLAAHALQVVETPEARGLLMEDSARPVRSSVLQPPDTCLQRTMSPDAKMLVCRSIHHVTAYDTATLAERWRVDQRTSRVDVTETGDVLAEGADDGAVRIFHGATGAYRPLPQPMRGPGQRTITSTHADRLGYYTRDSIVAQDRITGEFFRFESMAVGIRAAGITRQGHVLAVLGGELVEIRWTGEVIRRVTLRYAANSKSGSAYQLALADEAGLLAFGFLDGRVELRSLRSLELLSTVRPERSPVGQLRLSTDGRWLAAMGDRGAVWVWDIADPAGRVRLPGRAEGMEFDGNDELVVLGDRLWRWRLPDTSRRARLNTGSGMTTLDWHADLLAASLGSGRVRMWRHGQPPFSDLSFKPDRVTKDVAVAPDGGRALGSALNQQLRVGSFGEPGADLPGTVQAGCRRVLWLRPGNIICNALADGPGVYNLAGEEYLGLRRYGRELVDAEPNDKRTHGIIVAKGGEVSLVIGGQPPTLRTLFTAPGVSAVAITNDSDHVVTVTPSAVQLRTYTGDVVWEQVTRSRLRDVAVSGDDKLVAGGELNGVARVWRLSDGKPLAVIGAHQERVQAVAFSPDSTKLATGSWDESVRLWDLTVLHRTPKQLLADVESAWGMSLDDALRDQAGL